VEFLPLKLRHDAARSKESSLKTANI